MARDERRIQKQLGRTPRGLITISARCHRGLPLVIVTRPVLIFGDGRREIFPTTFYLTCPLLVKDIYALESQGWIAEIQQRLDADPFFRQRLLSSHREYREYRANLVSSEDRDLLERINSTGIGGIQGLGIKCLHAHYAHYRALGGNPVGEVIEGLLKDPEGENCQLECTDG